MFHSTVTQKGQTTIPGKIRSLLGIKAGDMLAYCVHGDAITIRVNNGTQGLKGILKNTKGKGMSFQKIRKAATTAALHKISS